MMPGETIQFSPETRAQFEALEQLVRCLTDRDGRPVSSFASSLSAKGVCKHEIKANWNGKDTLIVTVGLREMTAEEKALRMLLTGDHFHDSEIKEAFALGRQSTERAA